MPILNTLWKKLLFRATTHGININHITFTEPSIIYYSDVCEHGMGGYVVNGPAWRFKLPDHLIGVFTLNLLEFIASFLTIHLAISIRKDKDYPHRILAFTDSSSALGWLFKSTFNTNTHALHDKVARELAWFCTKNHVSLFTQHIPGCNNIIADALSRDFHLSDSALTDLLILYLPQQERCNFHIVPHPKKITSWLDSLKCGVPIKIVSVGTLTKSKLPTLQNGKSTLDNMDYMVHGSNPYQKLIKTSSLPVLPRYSGIITMGKLKQNRNSWETP